MVAQPNLENGHGQPQEKWNPMDDRAHDTAMPDVANGGSHPGDDGAPQSENPDYGHGSPVTGDAADAAAASQTKSDGDFRGEKQVKVYIGGLPEHTRKEDLESCFGKIGNIVNIELKVGYGFVEFDNREAAEESVAKYNEGYFMGNKIRVEISRGGGRTAKYNGDPGACFKCGQMGHWARECPNHTPNGVPHRRPSHHPSDAPLIDRIQGPPRDYPPHPRDYPPYRDDYRYGPPPRDARFGYDYAPPPPPAGREYRRPPTPPREIRDYPPPPVRSARDYDEYRMRGPPPPVPPPRYEARPGYYPPEGDAPPPGYPPRNYGPPPPREYYERFDRRPPPLPDRYGTYPAPPAVRPRTPPGAPPPRVREEFDRPPIRDYPPPPAEYRGRPTTPPPVTRYADYPARAGSSDAPARYRRRSQSPPSRVPAASGYEPAGYSVSSTAANYNGTSSGSFPPNGYSGGSTGGPPPPRSTGARDYPRGARDAAEPGGAYRRP
ncbi:hypothetical protein OBBRIDRAFT_839953 [Obba rivulosa]|uniref:RNA-binding domain-containing protein n=1 Tax=Obba rivulosa TaxID=1052685 RepID=A0A8E2AKS1_9APHY|nr:hypothetical protein OBBRIDRAFT_839953 [Obba rivulosa]